MFNSVKERPTQIKATGAIARKYMQAKYYNTTAS